MIAFWIDNSSLGSPSSAHSPMVPWSTKNPTCSTFVCPGTAFFCVSLRKLLYSLSLNSELNGPQYTTKAHTQLTSPTNRFLRNAKFFESSVHRAFSPERPDNNLFAASICRCIAAALSCNCFMAACALRNSASNSATSFNTAFNSSSAASSSACALASRASAIFNASIFGLTILAAPWYCTMAPTNLHSPAAAPLAFPASCGSRTGCEKGLQFFAASSLYRKYGSSNSHVSSLMLSFSFAANSRMPWRKFMSETSLEE
mmetsp:Transcript_17969/g.51825  ORF Transcript_17969/g.51825 Transcript_17969/m.51825 type:complete len:258 (+) Transcript_17969:2538-3311(+)